MKKSPVARRLLGGAGANLLGKIWLMLIQLLSVPILNAAWGVEGFGIWLMLTTIPTYLAMSDFGLATAAGIEITRAVSRNDHPAALRAFQTVWLLITLVTCVVAVAAGIGLAVWLGLSPPSGEGRFSIGEMAGAAFFVVIGAVFSAQMSIRLVVYQATHKYTLGHLINGFVPPVHGLAVIAVALSGGGLSAAAAAGAAVSAVMLMIFARVLTRLEPWCRIGTAHSDRATLRRLMHPSLAAFALTAANSFGLQGVVLTLGLTLGPAVAAAFATGRMISRIPLQFSSLLTRASLPELTRALVTGNTQLEARLMRLNLALTVAVLVPALAGLVFWGPALLSRLSGGEINLGPLLFGLFGLAALFNGIWTTLGTRLLAMNRQGEYAWLVLGLYAALALVPIVPGMSYTAIVVATVLAELAIALRVATWRGEEG